MNQRKFICFIHIEKCGGITLHHLIQNNLAFYVNLRCMEILDNKAKVYVGGGITEKSSAVKEWEEVLQKANTMAKVLVS